MHSSTFEADCGAANVLVQPSFLITITTTRASARRYHSSQRTSKSRMRFCLLSAEPPLSPRADFFARKGIIRVGGKEPEKFETKRYIVSSITRWNLFLSNDIPLHHTRSSPHTHATHIVDARMIPLAQFEAQFGSNTSGDGDWPPEEVEDEGRLSLLVM